MILEDHFSEQELRIKEFLKKNSLRSKMKVQQGVFLTGYTFIFPERSKE
jgi:hypothetical protein